MTNGSKTLVAITGNTYPVKEQLKALGARWDAGTKAWMVMEENAERARKIVSGAPSTPARGSYYSRHSRGRWTGCSMGCREGAPNPRCRECCFDEYDN